MKATAVIVEDEPLALGVLRDLLGEVEWLRNVGEAADGPSAVDLIDDTQPDLVFLDVLLPVFSGLEVLERISHDPAVIFTTAYDRYAVAAFELAALDYLIKPFGRDRFREAVGRAERALAQPSRPSAVDRARDALKAGEKLHRILVRHHGEIVPIAVEEIERLESDGDYVAVYARNRRHLVGLPLAEFEQRLDASRFLRIHRSHIVNLSYVKALVPYDGSRLEIEMRDGTRLLSSRARSKELRRLVL
jgi:two-component system LytT family response regulator